MVRSRPLRISLNAVIIAVTGDEPRLLTVDSGRAIPSGALADEDVTLELAVRRVVREIAGLELGYLEQLYTFGDRVRDPKKRLISVAYLALVRESGSPPPKRQVSWRHPYRLLPWEDWRAGRPEVIDRVIAPAVRSFSKGSPERRERAAIAFGLQGAPWSSGRVLERYELLYEVGLVAERRRDLSGQASPASEASPELGQPLKLDHRRMVATALARVRGKLSYRPVIFELLAEQFTLSQLRRVAEALAGTPLHTPNFRRLVDRGGLVEGTGAVESRTGGRPAELFRFRREVLRERPAPGIGLPRGR